MMITKEEFKKLLYIEKLTCSKISEMYNMDLYVVRNIGFEYGFINKHGRVIKLHNKGNCLNCGKEVYQPLSGTGKYCNRKCHKEHKSKEYYEKFLSGDEYFQRASYFPKTFKNKFLEEQNYKCSICGCENKHNNKQLVFILDHIDGDASNNKRDNLRLVCPNCDSQLDTYKSKNKNSSRHSYRYKKEKILNQKEKCFCKKCGKELSKFIKSDLCYECIKQRNIEDIYLKKNEIIDKFIEYGSIVGVGKYYGVSDNCIRNWLNVLNIPTKTKYLNKYIELNHKK